MKRIRTSIALVLCVLMFWSFNKSIDTSQLTPEELKKDVYILRKKLEKYHPGLYWYTSKAEFDLTWDSSIACIDKPMSEEQFFKLLLPLIAKVKCSHTLFYPSAKILSSGSRFPLDLKFIDGKGYVLPDSINQYQIPKGSELLSINGKSLNEIVDLLLPNLEAQGGNLGWKFVILENDFQNYYYYIIEQTEIFEIEYIDHVTGQRVLASVNGSTEPALRQHWKNWYPKETGGPLKIEFLTDPDVAIITIKSFSKGRHKQFHQDFDKLIELYFDEISRKRIQNLIIDVRGNEGGNGPEKLYSYIARENDRSTSSPPETILPSRNNFIGNVIVLANERSISAQETFVSIFRNCKRGIIVGKSTPGCYKGLTGGKKRRLVLPNSRHEIRIPMYASLRTYTEQLPYEEGEGFPPDFKVQENINEILAGKDLVVELALEKYSRG
ncbi:MAG TPA: S41 family peptidase [Ohtaekwangia sp.]|nr:S41 family peptidase [Ohtaekwangia sp.]